MFKGAGLSMLVGTLVVVSTLIIFLEWRAVRGLSKGPGHGGNSASTNFRGAANNIADGAEEGFLSKRQAQEAPALPSFPPPPEVRHRSCQGREYDLAKLPKVTMVIPYLNETWAQISATLASVLTYTPSELLDEILMVDDGNAVAWQHHTQLTNLHPKVRVHRNEERQGLIRSKVIGSKLVTSPVIIFMEPHCIVNPQWMEPLLMQLIQSDGHSTVVMPVLDIIPEDNFNDYKVANHHIGGFDWSLTFNWMSLITERNKSYVFPDPYPTPALSGGIFALWRDWWERSGTYDTNMTEWGGEHIEMSLRTWRCGGRIEIVPCSRIGHVFRAKNPYVVHPRQVVINQKRAALVWLDEHLEDFYRESPMARTLEVGDVTERLEVKKKLNCKSIDWYVKNVYPELLTHQPRRR